MKANTNKLVVGLGNPGLKYADTRHNIGFKIVRATCDKLRTPAFQTKCSSLYSKKNQWILALPTTYMNRSGKAVGCLLDKFEVDICQLLVVVDDINLPLGEIRLRKSGSAGGHNGLKSVSHELNTQNFKRLRFGVSGESLADDKKYLDIKEFVLSDFEVEEQEILADRIPLAVDLISHFLYENYKKMLDYNSKINSLSQD